MDELKNFLCFLIDNHEGTVLSEEAVMCLMSDFMKSKYYSKSAANSTGETPRPTSVMPKCAGCGNPVGIFVKRATGETEAYHHKCADKLGTLSA